MSNRRFWLTVVVFAVVVLWQEYRIRMLAQMENDHWVTIRRVDKLAEDVDWTVRQLPRHDGMRPSYFER